MCSRCVRCRFAAVRAGDKYRGAFEPVGDDLGYTSDNQYIALDKKTIHLVTKVGLHNETTAQPRA